MKKKTAQRRKDKQKKLDARQWYGNKFEHKNNTKLAGTINDESALFWCQYDKDKEKKMHKTNLILKT